MASNSTKSIKTTVSFEEGWPVLQEEAINKIINTLEGVYQNPFTSEEYMRFYTIVYEICCPNPIGPEAQRLYDHYRMTFEEYISSKVLPSLRGKKDEILLQELVKRWNNHKILTYWLLRFFNYIDRFFIRWRKLPTLQGTSYLIFYELVYGEFNDQVRDAAISLINREREGEQIDQALLKNVLDIYVEMGEDSMKYYEKDFEEAMFKDTAAFYSGKASDWVASKSYEDYMLKVEECLNQEKDRISTYLRDGSKNKLLEVLQNELLTVHESKLAEKKQLQKSAVHIDE